MTFEELKDSVCDEIRFALSNIEKNEIENFIQYILEVRSSNCRLFVIGAGRVMLILKTFAKRLKHLGINSYVVGETTVPAIRENDLLIAGSGSGETITTLDIAKLAKKYKAKIASVTASDKSSLFKISDICVKIPCPTRLHYKGEVYSIQPMANLFEQSLLIFLDCVSMIIQDKLKINEEEMWKVHANLE